MAIIRTENESGENHLPTGWLSGFATLCGMSEASDSAFSDAHEGTVTCEVCGDIANAIFRSVQPEEMAHPPVAGITVPSRGPSPMNIINRLRALHPLDGVQLSLTVNVTAAAFETLTTLGTEGVFYPITVSSPVAQHLIIDLSMIRDCALDFDKPQFTAWCREHLPLTLSELEHIGYLFVVGSDDI
ncbi:hypothetical protein [Hafnia alvei]|uniref:hypothetical protein n=1 Tax=Hafnia alvei TaxID=569 RepID=UPI00345D1F9E